MNHADKDIGLARLFISLLQVLHYSSLTTLYTILSLSVSSMFLYISALYQLTHLITEGIIKTGRHRPLPQVVDSVGAIGLNFLNISKVEIARVRL
jgi:hypothetical protein